MTADEMKLSLEMIHNILNTNINVMAEVASQIAEVDNNNVDFKREMLKEIMSLTDNYVEKYASHSPTYPHFMETYMSILSFGLQCSEKTTEILSRNSCGVKS